MVELSEARWYDHIRFVVSALILLFSMVTTSYAIVMQQTHFWDAVPGWAALLLFIVDLFILGIVEGLQIALVELKRQRPESYKKSHPRAYYLGQRAAKGDNTERFLMGRQVFVVFLVFFAAKLTTISLDEGEKFLFPAPRWFQAVFLETGILACIVVVIIAQLMPQIVAAKYPVHFLQLLVMRPGYYACMFVEMTGLTHVCWLLSYLFGLAAGMKDDVFTMNPTDMTAAQALKEMESYLEITIDKDSARGSSEDGDEQDEEDKKKNLAIGGVGAPDQQYTRYTELVQRINDTVSPDTLRVMKLYLDSHPEKFQQFPSVVGSKIYPAPAALAEQIREDGFEVPRFLTDISDPEHLPPHIVACELIAQNKHLQEEINFLKAKLGSIA